MSKIFQGCLSPGRIDSLLSSQLRAMRHHAHEDLALVQLKLEEAVLIIPAMLGGQLFGP